MSAPKKLFIKTYGCQMNVYDSERMAEQLGGEGYVRTETVDDAGDHGRWPAGDRDGGLGRRGHGLHHLRHEPGEVSVLERGEGAGARAIDARPAHLGVSVEQQPAVRPGQPVDRQIDREIVPLLEPRQLTPVDERVFRARSLEQQDAPVRCASREQVVKQ